MNIEKELVCVVMGTPATPSAGYVAIYIKSDGQLYRKDSSGLESLISSGGTSAPDYGMDLATRNLQCFNNTYS